MKAKRYLVTVACKQIDGRQDSLTLTHTGHKTFTGDAEGAQQFAMSFAADHTARATRRNGPMIAPAQIVSVEPVKHKKQRAKLITSRAKSDDDMERTAAEYARWLAQRDGIEIPASCKRAVAEWSGVHTNRLNKSGREIFERRIMSVRFVGHATTVRIELPNWSWMPAEPVEIIDEDQAELLAA